MGAMNLLTKSLCLMVRGYRLVISPVFVALFGPTGLGCRYEPTCSAYALDSLQKHGALRGCWLTLCRLARCHPWGDCGHDPVPEPDQFSWTGRGAGCRCRHSEGSRPARTTLSDPSIASF